MPRFHWTQAVSLTSIIILAISVYFPYKRHHLIHGSTHHPPQLNLDQCQLIQSQSQDQNDSQFHSMRFCDDPVIHRNTGMAYMLCDPGRVWWDPLRNTWEEKPGKKQEDHASVWAWDLQAKTPPSKLSIPNPPSGSFHPTSLLVTSSTYHSLNSTSPQSLLLMIVNHPYPRSSGVIENFVHVLNGPSGRSNKIIKHHSRIGSDKLKIEGKQVSPYKITGYFEQYSPPLPLGYRLDSKLGGLDAFNEHDADTDKGEESLGSETIQIPSFFYSTLPIPTSRTHPRTFDSGIWLHFKEFFFKRNHGISSPIINVFLARSEITRHLFQGHGLWNSFSPIVKSWNGGGWEFGSNTSAATLFVLSTGNGYSSVTDWEQHWVRGISSGIDLHEEPFHFIHKDDLENKGYKEISKVKSYTPEFFTYNEHKFENPTRGFDVDDLGRLWSVGNENSHELDDWIEYLREKELFGYQDLKAKKKLKHNHHHKGHIHRPSSIINQITHLYRSGPSVAHPWESKRLKSVRDRGIFLKKEYIKLPIFSQPSVKLTLSQESGIDDGLKELRIGTNGNRIGFLPVAPTGVAVDHKRGLVIITGAWEDRGVALCQIPKGSAEL